MVFVFSYLDIDIETMHRHIILSAVFSNLVRLIGSNLDPQGQKVYRFSIYAFDSYTFLFLEGIFCDTFYKEIAVFI